MSRRALLSVLPAVLLGAPVGPVQGQAASPGDSAYASALLSLRDSAAQIRIQLGAFQRDLALAGPETVVGRARALNRRCTGLVDAARSLAPTLQTGKLDAAGEMTDMLERLGRGLGEHCVRGLSPDGGGSHADTLRAWGPHRVAQVERLLTEYDRTAHRFARAIGVKLEPRAPRH